MAKGNLTTVSKARFTESEYAQLFDKITVCCAGIEALWDASNNGDARARSKHVDSMLILAQVAGFVADYGGQKCGGYGDLFTWLEIPKEAES